MIRRRIRRLYKRFLKPVFKPSAKWLRKRLRSARARRQYTGTLLTSLLRHPASLWYVPAWLRSLRFAGPPLAVAVPNWPYAATRYLERQLRRLNTRPLVRKTASGHTVRCLWRTSYRRRAVVFEYGGGNSTLWLAGFAESLTTVEHDAGWFTRVQDKLTETGLTHCEVLFREPRADADPADADDAGYRSDKYPGSFADYVRTIDEFPDDSFDLVIVDGRSRTACLHHAARTVRPGGLLVLDDSDREAYRAAMQGLNGWARKDFYGIKPFQTKLGYTSCWVKPAPRTEPDRAAPAAPPQALPAPAVTK